MKGTIRLGKITGIEVSIHYSWFVVLAFFSWSLASEVFPTLNEEWGGTHRWAIGVLTTLLLFASVLIHELAHSLVAKARGFPVGGITLFILGGVTNLRAEARRPRDEFLISVVGPATSLALAGLLLITYRAIGDSGTPLTPLGSVTTPLTSLEAVLLYLWFINFVLALFNLLPAFPMDGGRMLRSVLWGTTGNLSSATRVAMRGGQAIGLLLIAMGIMEALRGIFPASLWWTLIGWFLFSTATGSRKDIKAQAGETEE